MSASPYETVESVPMISDEEFEKVWNPPPGLYGFIATVQNGPIGVRFIMTSFLFFILAGIAALVMRTQLAVPDNTLVDPETYNRLFTMHGSTMMFLFTVPLVEGVATLVLPQMLGSRELPFPRLTAFAYWTFLIGGLIFYSSFFFNAVPDAGWFAYVPLSGETYSRGLGMDFWLLGLGVAEIGAIAGAFEIIVAVFKMRAPGMSLNRIPVFAWAMLVTAFMMVFAFTPLVFGSAMLELDRMIGTDFFNPETGGDALLWQHIFWIFGHPEVYIQFIPAAGMISTIVPVFAQKRLVGYTLVVLSMLVTGFLSFGLWVHHMFATGLGIVTLSIFSAASVMITFPTAIQISCWLATLYKGKIVWKTPMLFTVGFFFNFIIGGLTGVMIAIIPFNVQVHDTYFIVAHLHYVLIGGMLFPIFAGLYYWVPKFANRMLDERLGQINFWLVFIGFNVTFFPMHISGILGMSRRVYTYPAGTPLSILNLISTIGAFILAAGVLSFIVNYVYSRKNNDVPGNPWNADTLEWATPTPAYQYGFRRIPIVHSRHPLWDDYELSEGDEKTEKLLELLERWPNEWRAQLVTSVVDGEPQELFRVAEPSIWPFVAAIGVMGFSFVLIFKWYLLAVGSIVLMIIGLLGWHNTDYAQPTRDSTIDEDFEAKTGIPVRAQGSHHVSWWGMSLTVMTLCISIATLTFSYFYLRLNSLEWPPANIANPQLLLPIIGTVVFLVSVFAMWWAEQGEKDDDKSKMLTGLLGASGLAILYMVIMAYYLGTRSFSFNTNAYGSIFFLNNTLQYGLIAMGVLMTLATAFWLWRSDEETSLHVSTRYIALYWYFTAFALLFNYSVLYLVPYSS